MIQAKITWAFILLGIEFLVKPTLSLFTALMVVVTLDLITGIMKAKFKKEERTSDGYRKTIVKLMQYITPILLLWVSGRWIPEYKLELQSASGYVTMFVIYIEVTSIFENLYEIDKKSTIAKFLYRPALKVLKFGIENNPVTQAADKLENDKKSEVKL